MSEKHTRSTVPTPEAASVVGGASGEVSPGSGEAVTSITMTPEMLVGALHAQSEIARQRMLEEQAARQADARNNLAAMMEGLQEKADANPRYYRDPVLNRYEAGRRQKEKAEIEQENEGRRERGEPEIELPGYEPVRDYAAHGANRFGIAALEGVAFGPGDTGSLAQKNGRQHRQAIRAARVASKNLGVKMAKEEFERDPRKSEDDKRRGGGRYGGVAIDTETGLSRFREDDPKLKTTSPLQRKIIKRSERSYKKLARKHHNQEHYLRNQGKNFLVRHNIDERLGSRILSPSVKTAGRISAKGSRLAGRGVAKGVSTSAKVGVETAKFTGELSAIAARATGRIALKGALKAAEGTSIGYTKLKERGERRWVAPDADNVAVIRRVR